MLFQLFSTLSYSCLFLTNLSPLKYSLIVLLNINEISTFKIPQESLALRAFTLSGGKKKTKKYVNDIDTSVSNEVLEALHANCKDKLTKVENNLQTELSKIGIHRATPGLIENTEVELQNGKKQLKHIARIVTSGNFELLVQPFEETNLNPIFCSLSMKLDDFKIRLVNKMVLVSIPPLTSEMKKQVEFTVKQLLNQNIASIRIIRQNTMKSLKALENGLSDDMLFAQKNKIDENCKIFTKKVDKLCNDKLGQL